MEYLIPTVLALLAFGLHDFVAKLISIHGSALLLAGIASTLGGILILAVSLSQRITPGLDKFTLFACLLGVMLGFGYAFYILAISKGPISIVTPIIGLYFLVPSALGVMVLREEVTLAKVGGVVLAGLAIYLLTR